MSALKVNQPFPIFTDINGQPLESGFVWIGTANLDPQTNPINVYWDAALTIPAAQPIRTLSGYTSNSGTPARLYVNSDYSIRVMNKNGSTLYTSLNDNLSGDDLAASSGASLVGYLPAGTGAVATTVQAKLRESVSVLDFKNAAAIAGDWITAFRAATTYCETAGVPLDIPAGTYLISDSWTPPDDIWVSGVGQLTRIGATAALAATSKAIVLCDSIGQATYKLQDFAIAGPGVTPSSNTLVGLQVGSSRNSIFNKITITGCWSHNLLLRSDVNGQDIENPVFNQVYTVFGGGLLLHANSAVTRGNITDGGFFDCNLATDISDTSSLASCAVEFICDAGKLIFGITMATNFCQPRNAPTLKMTGSGLSIYNCRIESLQADVWGTTGQAIGLSNLVYGVELSGVSFCVFDRIVITAESAGWNLVNCFNNEISGLKYDSYKGVTNGRLLTIDSSSYQNLFTGVYLNKNNYLEGYGGAFANSQNTIFGYADLPDGSMIMIRDSGYGNVFIGGTISSSVSIINNPSKLLELTGTDMTHYPSFTEAGVTCAIVLGKLQITFPIGYTGLANIPLRLPKKFAGIRLKYKTITTGFTGTLNLHLAGVSKLLIHDNTYRECCFINDAKAYNYAAYGFYIAALSTPVTMEVEVLEVYDGYSLPYIYNYSAAVSGAAL